MRTLLVATSVFWTSVSSQKLESDDKSSKNGKKKRRNNDVEDSITEAVDKKLKVEMAPELRNLRDMHLRRRKKDAY